MSNEPSIDRTDGGEDDKLQGRRMFLQCLGKWSGAAIVAATAGTAWFATAPEAAGWINRRVGGGGGWINRRGGGWGGGWINGGGGWINRRVGGGSWINRW